MLYNLFFSYSIVVSSIECINKIGVTPSIDFRIAPNLPADFLYELLDQICECVERLVLHSREVRVQTDESHVLLQLLVSDRGHALNGGGRRGVRPRLDWVWGSLVVHFIYLINYKCNLKLITCI